MNSMKHKRQPAVHCTRLVRRLLRMTDNLGEVPGHQRPSIIKSLPPLQVGKRLPRAPEIRAWIVLLLCQGQVCFGGTLEPSLAPPANVLQRAGALTAHGITSAQVRLAEPGIAVGGEAGANLVQSIPKAAKPTAPLAIASKEMGEDRPHRASADEATGKCNWIEHIITAIVGGLLGAPCGAMTYLAITRRLLPNAKVSDGWPSSNSRIAKQRGGPAIRSTVLFAQERYSYCPTSLSLAARIARGKTLNFTLRRNQR